MCKPISEPLTTDPKFVAVVSAIKEAKAKHQTVELDMRFNDSEKVWTDTEYADAADLLRAMAEELSPDRERRAFEIAAHLATELIQRDVNDEAVDSLTAMLTFASLGKYSPKLLSAAADTATGLALTYEGDMAQWLQQARDFFAEQAAQTEEN